MFQKKSVSHSVSDQAQSEQKKNVRFIKPHPKQRLLLETPKLEEFPSVTARKLKQRVEQEDNAVNWRNARRIEAGAGIGYDQPNHMRLLTRDGDVINSTNIWEEKQRESNPKSSKSRSGAE